MTASHLPELDVVRGRVWIPFVSPKIAANPTALPKNQARDYQAGETQSCDDAADLELLDINMNAPNPFRITVDTREDTREGNAENLAKRLVSHFRMALGDSRAL